MERHLFSGDISKKQFIGNIEVDKEELIKEGFTIEDILKIESEIDKYPWNKYKGSNLAQGVFNPNNIGTITLVGSDFANKEELFDRLNSESVKRRYARISSR